MDRGDDALKRLGGRPPIDEAGPGTRVCVRLSAAMYDALYAVASAEQLNVCAVIREAISLKLTENRRP